MHVGKKVYVGLESSGKSLLMAQELKENIDRNAIWFKITGLPRPIFTNMALSSSLIEYAKSKGVEILEWSDLWDLVYMSECDLYIDEIGTYFDSRTYADLPLDVRLWLGQAEKLGVQIVGGAQDYFQVDISYRRLVKKVYEVKKVIGSKRPMKTSPPVRRVWGVMFLWELDARSASQAGNQEAMKSINFLGLPALRSIKKSNVALFDTNVRVRLSNPPPLRKIVRICPEDGYTQKRYV